MTLTGENRSTGRKTWPSATCPPQMLHGLAWDRTQAMFRPPVRASCSLLRLPVENSTGRKLTDGLYRCIRNRFGN